jgi:methylated-DNA-[protein]-cysteine S-methyltransferase
MILYSATFASPAGHILLTEADGRLRSVLFERQWAKGCSSCDGTVPAETPLLKEAKTQLAEYFGGARTEFNLPIELAGTEFQRRAWEALARIPFGETRCYSEQAALIGAPNAVRAVGRANSLNPICIVIPCHRVVGKSGHLTGYAGGMGIKDFLLKHEQKVMGFQKPRPAGAFLDDGLRKAAATDI